MRATSITPVIKNVAAGLRGSAGLTFTNVGRVPRCALVEHISFSRIGAARKRLGLAVTDLHRK